MKTVTSQSFPGGKKVKHEDDRFRLRRGRGLAVLMSAAAIAWQAHSAHAATFTWDPGATPVTPSGGTGTWDLATPVWSNGTADVAWTDNTGANDTAIFAGATGTVTMSTNVGALGMVFTTAGYNFTGTGIIKLGTTTVTSNGIDTSAVGTGSETLGSIDVGSSQTWNLGAAAVTFNGAVRDNGVSKPIWTINGTGTTQFAGGLTLSNTNSNRTITVAGSQNVDISGLITDGGTNIANVLVYQGTGTLSLDNAANTFQTSANGGVGAASGTLIVANDGALGNPANIMALGLFTNGAVGPVTFQTTGSSTLAIAHAVAINSSSAFPVTIAGTQPLNVTGSVSFDTNKGITQTLNVNVPTTFAGNVFLGNTTTGRTETFGGTSSLNITGVVADSSSAGATSTLIYNGTGTLTLSNATNTYSGMTIVDNGTVVVTDDGSLGVNPTLSLGPTSGASVGTPTFASMGNSPVTIAHGVTIDTTSADFLTFGGATPLNFSNTITINGASTTSETINANDTGGTTFASNVFLSNSVGRTVTFGGTGNLNITGVVADSSVAGNTSSLIYNGTGTLTLSNGANTYSGSTTVASGELAVTNTTGSATGTGNVTMNAGILASGAVGAISGNVLAGTAAHTIAPGGVGTIGSLSIGGLTTSTLTTLNFDLGSGAGPEITTGDLLTLGSGTVSIASGTLMTFGGTPVTGDDYRLIGGTIGAIPLANFSLPTAPAGQTFSLSTSVDAGFIDLVVGSSGPPNLTWNNAASTGVWNTVDANWNNGSGNAAYVDTANVTFNDNNPSSTPANYNVTLNTTVSPGSVMLSNASNNYVISGSGSIAGTGSLTRNNIGTATLNTVNTYSGGTDVFQGTLIAGVAGAIPNGPVTIEFGILQLAASTGGTTITSLTINGNGTLDITNNHVIIDYGSNADPVSSIAALLATGYNGGAWNGVGGITSSAIAANPGYGVGYADSADTGNPAGLASGTMEIAFTLLGDADLNHTVNGIDFGILAANFNKGVSRWDQGDFNYDNIVNGVDFGSLAANFNKGASSAGDFAALEAFAAANGLLADVPEPAMLALLAFGAIGMLARRRRKTFG